MYPAPDPDTTPAPHTWNGVNPSGVFRGGDVHPELSSPTDVLGEAHRQGWRWLHVYAPDGRLVGRIATVR